MNQYLIQDLNFQNNPHFSKHSSGPKPFHQDSEFEIEEIINKIDLLINAKLKSKSKPESTSKF